MIFVTCIALAHTEEPLNVYFDGKNKLSPDAKEKSDISKPAKSKRALIEALSGNSIIKDIAASHCNHSFQGHFSNVALTSDGYLVVLPENEHTFHTDVFALKVDVDVCYGWLFVNRKLWCSTLYEAENALHCIGEEIFTIPENPQEETSLEDIWNCQGELIVKSGKEVNLYKQFYACIHKPVDAEFIGLEYIYDRDIGGCRPYNLRVRD